jgi:hypothetical protein
MRENAMMEHTAALQTELDAARVAKAAAERAIADAAAAAAAGPETERRLTEERRKLEEEARRVEAVAADLRRQDAELAEGAKRAELAFRAKAEALRAAQQRAEQVLAEADAAKKVAESVAEATAAKEKAFAGRASQLEDQERRISELRKEVREKLSAVAEESHRLAALRKDTGTPRTPLVGTPGIGRFMAAPQSVFRPLDPPKIPSAGSRSPRTPRGHPSGASTEPPLLPPVPSIPFDFGTWDADVLAAADASQDFAASPLVAVATAATERLRLHDIAVPTLTWHHYLKALEHHYNPNPYHNVLHAADVTHSAYCLLTAFPDLMDAMPAVEKFALIFAAAVHDVGHAALTSSHLNRRLDPVAIAANFTSTNEHGHLALAFALVQQPKLDVTTLLSEGDLRTFTKLVADLVYHTDMERHATLLVEAEATLGSKPDLSKSAHRRMLLRLLLHAADLGACARADDAFGDWDSRIRTEFAMQAHREQDMGLEPAAELTVGDKFIATAIAPLFGLVRSYWPDGAVEAAVAHVQARCDPADVPPRASVSALEGEVEALRDETLRLRAALEYAQAQFEKYAEKTNAMERAAAAASAAAAPAVAVSSSSSPAAVVDLASLPPAEAAHHAAARLAALQREVAEKEVRLEQLADFSRQLAASEASMAHFVERIVASHTDGEPGNAVPGTAEAHRSVIIDAAAVVAQREAVAREKMAEAAREIARANAMRIAAESRIEAANDIEARAAETSRLAEELLKREVVVGQREQWVQRQTAAAFGMAAKQLAVQEAEQRVTLAAEELHGVYRAARDRVLRLAALEAQMTASNDLLAERAAREKAVREAIAASHERRRRVAQARVLQQQKAEKTEPEPWLHLERQLYAFTAALGSIANP